MLTLINGNGQPYTKELPKIVILGGEHINDIALAHIKENTGLGFFPCSGGIEAQPKNAEQIVKLFMTYNFKTKYYDNWDHHNTIFLKFDHHVGFSVDKICYNCVKDNHITTNGLKPGDYLAT